MQNIKRTSVFKRIFFSRGMAVVITLVVFVGLGLSSIVSKSMGASKARHDAEAEAADLVKKKVSLQAKLDALDTPEGRESVLREQYPVVSPGEHVVVITQEDAPRPTVAAPSSSTDPSAGFWSFLQNIFSKKSE